MSENVLLPGDVSIDKELAVRKLANDIVAILPSNMQEALWLTALGIAAGSIICRRYGVMRRSFIIGQVKQVIERAAQQEPHDE